MQTAFSIITDTKDSKYCAKRDKLLSYAGVEIADELLIVRYQHYS